ncbi:MAG: 50S ribosomal protein L24 [Bacteroidetes bacterium]|nr:50S ribosomal protein L24 [Bacteroidota bacterium]
MPNKLHIKKGDIVKVIAGDSRGEQGKVLMVNPTKLNAIVEGVNLVTKHSKPNAKSPQGGIIKQEAPVHLSNLMVVDNSGKPTRTGRRIDPKSEKLVRYSKKSGEVIK